MMNGYRHSQALGVFIGVLFLFFVAEAVMVSSQLQQILNHNFQNETSAQIELMADSAYEPVLKADFVTIRTFIDRWSSSNPNYLELRAIAPNGFVIDERIRPAPPDARISSLRKTLSLDGTELLRLELTANSTPSVNAIAASLRNRLFIYAVLFTTTLGIVLWRALQTMAIKPLEQEIIRRTRAEEKLRQAHDQLEVTVQKRTADLHQELAERRRIEAELALREERIRLLLESTAEGIFGVDASGLCTFCNPSALRLLGYDHETGLLGTTMNATIHLRPDGSPYPEQESIIAQAYLTGQGRHSDSDLFQRQDGTSFPVECWSYPINDGDLRLGAVVTFIDITERKRLESQLIHTQKMDAIGILAGGIAHDFNNILSPILGYIELAMRKADPGSPITPYLQSIHQASCRARDLVRQILTFSRRDSEGLSPVAVNQVAQEALNLLKASLPSTIEIRQDFDPRCGQVMADPTKIHQIIMNLGANAYQAMGEPGGILTVSTTPLAITTADQGSRGVDLTPGNYLVLKVSDTGQGMDPATMARIFEPYYTTKPTGQGTGMGLSVVHGIIKSYGGQITVDSEISKGTAFQVYLPVTSSYSSASPADAAGSPPPLPTGTERIMLIDDEERVLRVEAELLENLGYRVHAFSAPFEALAEFNLRPDDYDLIITDVTMPLMTGDTLAQKILALRPGIPIIMCSGFSPLVSADTARHAGITAYIDKPIKLEVLANTLRQTLDSVRT